MVNTRPLLGGRSLDSLVWLIAPVVLIGVQQIFFPAPAGAVLQGTVLGLITALVSVGMVLIYRANTVLNFAQAELGLLPLVLALMLQTESGFPYLAAFGIGLVASFVVGGASEFLVVRRFSESPRLMLTVATLGLAQLLGLGALLLPRWWDARLTSQRIEAPFDVTFDFAGFRFNGNHLVVLVGAPLVLAGVGWMLQYTRAGLGIRAAAERPVRAGTLGIPVKGLQTLVWAVAGALAFLALWMRAGIIGTPVLGQLGVLFLLRALAAAMVGRLQHLGATVLSSIALGILQVGVQWNAEIPDQADAVMVSLTAALILVVLLARRRTFTRFETMKAALSMGETRPIPPALARRPEIRAVRMLMLVGAAVIVYLLPNWLDTGNTLRMSALYIFSIQTMSLVVLTGWAGQISLGQVALSGVGSAVGAWLTFNWQADLLVATLAGALAGALVAVLIGLPALRLQGLYLAVTSLAFAAMMGEYFLNPQFFDWMPNKRIPRLPLFGQVSYESPRGMYFVSVAGLLLAVVAIQGLRSSRTGRVLLALRDNEPGVTAYGVSVMRAKLMAFAISGFLAGMGGALFVHQLQSFDGGDFAFGGIGLFIAAVVGGIGSAFGAFLGSLFLWGTDWWLTGTWRLMASGIGVLTVLLIAPGGLAGIVYEGRDWLLRKFAKWRGLDSPSILGHLVEFDPALDTAPNGNGANGNGHVVAEDTAEVTQ